MSNPSWNSMIIDRVRSINNDTNVNSFNEHTVNTIKRDILKTFNESPDWELVRVNGEEEQREMLIVNGDSFAKKRAITKPNDLNLNYGDMLEVYEDEFDDRREYIHWLVTDINAKKKIYSIADITRCNTLVRWQNLETLEIIERWAIDDRPYSTNLNIDKTIVSPKKEFILKFKSDEETLKLGVNRRFLLYSMYDPSNRTVKPVASVIQAHNPVNTPFVIELNVVEDASYNVATDNAELMIADYIDPTITINIIPIPSLLLGDSVLIKYEFYQQNRPIDVVPKFESSDENIATVSETGLVTAHQLGNVQITISAEGKYASETISINVVNMQVSERILTITGANEIRHKRESEYTGFIFDNGVRQIEKVFWHIDKMSLTGLLPTLTVISDNSVKVTIPDNINNVDKKFKLICKDELNTLNSEIEIEIVSAFA